MAFGGILLIRHSSIDLWVLWGRMTGGGKVYSDMYLPVSILSLLQPLVPSRGSS